jgi:hypothetical protein
LDELPFLTAKDSSDANQTVQQEFKVCSIQSCKHMNQFNADGTITPAYIHELLSELSQSGWYGTIEAKLEAGRIVFIEKNRDDQADTQRTKGRYDK